MTAIALPSAASVATELVALAQERSPSKRLELLRRIADNFVEETSETSAATRYLLDEIIRKIVAQLRGGERAAASSSLARIRRLPDAVARDFAGDGDIAVARPILQGYRGLSDHILVDIATTGSQAHLHAIAGRSELNPLVTDIVVQRGDTQVVCTLAANKGARFSRFGMRTLIDKAETEARLHELIVDRSDLTFEAIGQLLPIISQELASRLRGADLEINAVLVQDQVVTWMSDRKRTIDKVNHAIDGIRRGTLMLEKAVIDLALERKLLDVASVIAACCALERDYAFNLLTQGKTDNVLLLLKSLALPWPCVDVFLKLRLSKLGESICGPMIEEATYESIDGAAAQRVIRFLKVRRAAMSQPPDRNRRRLP